MRKSIIAFAVALVSQSITASINPVHVTLRVVDAETGACVAGSVTMGAETPSIETSAQTCRVDIDLPAGEYRTTVRAPGHRSLESTFDLTEVKTLNVDFIVDPENPVAVFSDDQQREIIGWVVDDETRQPLSNVRVTMAGSKAGAVTDARGFFRLRADPSHAVDLKFTAGGHETLRMSGFGPENTGRKLRVALRNGSGEREITEPIKEERESLRPSATEAFSTKRAPVLAAAVNTYFKQPPSSIRVGYNCSGVTSFHCTAGCSTCLSCSSVAVLSLETYVQEGLDNEWSSTWTSHSLKAGAVAYRTFGAYKIANPVSGSYDIVNNDCNQAWSSTIAGSAQSAAIATSGILLVNSSNGVAYSQYLQHTNDYDGYLGCGNCSAGDPSYGWACLSDNVECNVPRSGRGWGMSQYGSKGWAELGYSWYWILSHYYYERAYPKYTVASPINMTSGSTSTGSVNAGGAFTIYAYSSNTATDTHSNIMFGASLCSGATCNISDPPDDARVTLTPGSNTSSRRFVVPSGTSMGTYDVLIAFWYDVNGNGAIDGSDLILAARTLPGAISVSDFSCYSISKSVTPSGAGSVSVGAPNCGTGYTTGSVISVSATAAPGYHFTGWAPTSGGTFANPTQSSTTFTITSNATVTAQFAPDTPTLTVALTGSGTVISSPAGINCPGTCSWQFSLNSVVSLTPTAALNYTFSGWGGDCGGGGVCQVSMSAARNVTANFTPVSNTRTLTVTKSGTGSGTVTSSPAAINCGSTCSASFASNTPVTLSASANSGSTFSAWGGACSGGGDCTVTMNMDQNVSASFTAQSGTIYVSATLDGQPWSGGLSHQLSGPVSTGSATVPVQYSAAAGTYTISYQSGGPANATFTGTDPSTTGTLSAGSSLSFTFRFSSNSTCAAPSTPTVQASATAASGATYFISWSATSPDNFYECQESTSPDFSSTVGGTLSGTSAGFAHVVTQSTTYYYRVRALQSCGGTTYSSNWGTAQVTVTAPPCTPSPLPTSAQFDSAGGTGSILVDAGASCPWTASTASSFVTIVSGASGTGYGRITYSVAPNTVALQRSATITVAGKNVTIVQLAGGTALLGTLPSAFPVHSNSASDWKMVGAADFDGDHNADLVYQNLTTGTIVVWYMRGTWWRSDAVIGTTSDPLWRVVAVADFNRDGSADLLLQNAATGVAYLWLLSGTTVLSTNTYVGRSSTIDWRMVGAADLNRDGSVDIVLQNRVTLQTAVWLMNGVTVSSTNTLLRSVSGSDWLFEALGDLNGDGNADIILRNVSNGLNAVWYMSGVTVLSTDTLLPPATDLNWRIGAAGDFNADGKLDLAWQNSMTRENAFWFMNGASILPLMRPLLSNSSGDWKMVGGGDFDGDGHTDLLFQNYVTRQLVVWAMNGTTALRTDLFLPSVYDTSWHVVAVADFNRDGRPDLLVQNTVTQLVYMWTMNGLVPFATNIYVGRVSAGWTICAVADVNRDNSVDIILQNPSTGELAAWLMSGTVVTSTDNLFSPRVSPGWRVRAAAYPNANGTANLIMRNDATGQVAVWLMNGLTATSTDNLLPTVADVNWRIVAAADLDGDRNADLLWQSSATRQNGVWLLNDGVGLR